MFAKGFKKKEKLKGGLADGLPSSLFVESKLKKGKAVEKEHTKNPAVAEEIAKDHLAEDPNYYEKLEHVMGKEAGFAGAFQKTAFLGAARGAIAGTVTRGARAAQRGIQEFATKQRLGYTGAYRQAAAGKSQTGMGLAGRRLQAAQQKAMRPFSPSEADQIVGKTQRDILKRRDRLAQYKQKSQASFAQRHPFLTAGGIAGGAYLATRGGDQQPSMPVQPPQVIYQQ